MEITEYKKFLKLAVEDIKYICEEALDHDTSWEVFKMLIEDSMKKNQMWINISKKKYKLP